MKSLALALCVAVFVAMAPAAAQTFLSAYAPRAGERAELSIEKCRSDTRGENLERACLRLTYLEEVLAPAPTGAPRIRYTLQRVDLPEGGSLTGAWLGPLGVGAAIIFYTDEGGSPIRIENRAEVFENLMTAVARVGNAEPAALQQTRALFEGMDDLGFAQVMGQDFSPLTIFQGIDAVVGEPVTGQLELPFPLDPTQGVLVNARLLLTSIDTQAGVAHATYEQQMEEASLLAAIQAFIARVPAAQGQSLAGIRLSRRDHAIAVIDVASGATVEVTHTSTTEVSQGEARQVRIERVAVRRRMLNGG